jgi:predicted membrane chloride channel (bestrophin family)
MNFYRSLLKIINLKTLIVTILAVVTTYLCIRFKMEVKFDLILVGIAVVFPIVFTIGGAYTKREDALKLYATMKGHSRSLYYATRDWFEKRDEAAEQKLVALLNEYFISVRDLFQSTNDEEKIKKEKHVYAILSNLSLFVQEYRDRGLQSGEVSRANQYISKMIDAFEGLKHIFQYRTPITLRAYSKIFVIIIPIVYGPYFATLAKDIPVWLAYVQPVLFSVVLVSLDNIQNHLENPFDLIGADDVKINAEKFVSNLTYTEE